MLAETVEALDAGLAPEDAFQCFMCTDLDLLVLGNVILRKSEQDPSLRAAYGREFESD
jgi:carbamoyltransferase